MSRGQIVALLKFTETKLFVVPMGLVGPPKMPIFGTYSESTLKLGGGCVCDKASQIVGSTCSALLTRPQAVSHLEFPP